MSNNKIQTVAAAAALLLSVLLAACSAGGRQQRLTQLEELERRNQSDSLMTDDSLALALADWFDSHGTPNERLRAHYILGRTYADLGEAPAAVNAYQDAASCADTTAHDCDWAKLSRVYGQMSDVMYKQNLMDDYIKAIDRSMECAWRAGDTVQAFSEKMLKVMAYGRKDEPDSLLTLFDEAFCELKEHFGVKYASKYSLIAVKTLLDRGELERAKSLIGLYEQESGYVDSLGYAEKGKEQYYYYKGLYYAHCHQMDSAEHLFRRELRDGEGFFIQTTGAHGLANLFWQEQRYDSAAKYALYSYAMMDSVYAHKATEEVKRAMDLYNYSRFQRMALHEQRRATQEKEVKVRMSYLLLLSLTALAVLLSVWQRRRRKARRAFETILAELSGVQQEIHQLQEQKDIYQELINEKNEAIQRLEGDVTFLQCQKLSSADKEMTIRQKNLELNDLQQRNTLLSNQIEEGKVAISQLQAMLDKYHKIMAQAKNETEKSLVDSGVFPLLRKSSPLTANEWKNVCNIVNDRLPKFSRMLHSKQEVLSKEEQKLCILFRLHCSQKDICMLMDMKQSNVSKRASIIMMKLFNERGGGRALQQRLEEIC